MAVEDGHLRIRREGKAKKFVRRVEQITFSGKRAAESEQRVLYVTERCVFKLTARGLELIEVAPASTSSLMRRHRPRSANEPAN